MKVGDYGLSHCKYRVSKGGQRLCAGAAADRSSRPSCPFVLQEDYLVTADQLWVPLRWIAPELVDEVHGNLLVVDQTKTSNVW